MTVLEALQVTTEAIKSWIEGKFFKKGETTANDFGIYVQPNEPVNAVVGDIWIDTSSDPSFTTIEYPTTLSNPYAITFTGASNSTYDGSSNVTVNIPKVPTKLSEFDNDKGFISNYTEIDPTVPEWAKASIKPTYTKSEVGLGNVDNIKQYSSNNPPPYPVTSVNKKTGDISLDASDVGARSSSWMPTYSDVGAEKSGTASSTVSTHNTSTTAHNDIRLLVSELTTNKVNISDIVNNLTTDTNNKPLSAAQGVVLKSLIDAVVVPTKLSQLTNDSGYIKSYTETDPTVPSWAKSATKPSYTASEVGALPSTTKIPSALSDLTDDTTHRLVTDSEKSAWNAKAEVSKIPTKVSQLTNDSKYLTSFTESDPTVPSWAKASSKPSYTKSEIGLSNVDNVKQYSANNPPPYPVTSVNGKTGAVSLDASAVGARSSSWTPTRSDIGLGNVDNVKQYSASNPPPYPVTSVNGKTGAVTISSLPSVTTSDNGKVLMVVNGVWQAVDMNISVDENGVIYV